MSGRTNPLLLFPAFLRRDFFAHLSYRLKAALDLLSIVIYVASFYFIAKLVGRTEIMAPYGGDYFPFVLIGIALSAYQSVGLRCFSQSIREEQFMGTLESVLAAPVSVSSFLLASAQWDFLYATVEAGGYLLAGVFLFGAALPAANFSAAAVIAFLTLCTLLSLGILSAAFIVKFKRGDPVAWLLTAVSELLGGVFFPTSLLPGSLRTISRFIPMTYSLDGLRLALLKGASVSDVMPYAWTLAAFTAILMPAGVLAFRKALDSARREGSLGHY